MQRSPLFQEDLDFPLLFHFAPGADYEGAVPLMTRWHINLYYQEPLWLFFFFSIYLLIITLNNYIYSTTEKKTLTIEINRVKQN